MSPKDSDPSGLLEALSFEFISSKDLSNTTSGSSSPSDLDLKYIFEGSSALAMHALYNMAAIRPTAAEVIWRRLNVPIRDLSSVTNPSTSTSPSSRCCPRLSVLRGKPADGTVGDINAPTIPWARKRDKMNRIAIMLESNDVDSQRQWRRELCVLCVCDVSCPFSRSSKCLKLDKNKVLK